MSGKVVLGIGIGALAGAAIFGVGFWIARRAVPALSRPELGLHVTYGSEGRAGLEGPHAMPFGFGLRHWMAPMGPEGMIEGAPFGHMEHDFVVSIEPLTEAEARQAVESFLASNGQAGLRVGDVLAFEDHSYAVVEKSATGTGAFEVVVLAGPRGAHVEYAPTTQWNTEFGMLARPMVGDDPLFGFTGPDPSVTPSVTADHAADIARAYLETHHPGMQVGEVRTFPGYFTLRFDADGTFAGLLSVNAYTGQVWERIWHGKLVESSD